MTRPSDRTRRGRTPAHARGAGMRYCHTHQRAYYAHEAVWIPLAAITVQKAQYWAAYYGYTAVLQVLASPCDVCRAEVA